MKQYIYIYIEWRQYSNFTNSHRVTSGIGLKSQDVRSRDAPPRGEAEKH